MNAISRRHATALFAASTLAALAACSSDKKSDSGSASSSNSSSANSPLAVSVSFYPIQFLVTSLAGDLAKVTSVTPTNVEPHDFELSPKDVTDLSNANMIVYVQGFQPSLDDAVAQISGPTVINLLDDVHLEHHEGVGHHHHHGDEDEHEEHDHDEHDHDNEEGHDHDHEHEEGHDHDHEEEDEALDPHFWLDPIRMKDAATAVHGALVKALPDSKDTLNNNLELLNSQLDKLNEDYKNGLKDTERRTFVTSHAAFGYMAERYDLKQVSVSGIDPESEPSPADLAAVKKVIEETGTTTVFTEELVSPKTAEALAAETGATTAVLNPIESAPEDGDYLTAMESNLTELKKALGAKN
ncbi:metal ABC transporter substrate-binding protein [Actinomyces vulturis]|uniref:metal ABC transporter substrate-binding protein n=1 Tax=Actinomyces vulturis TaxID=1857645 RepID=UPI00082B5C35|nr:metal ABC transporter substrate-binding protein [Actinomyces vulturis]